MEDSKFSKIYKKAKKRAGVVLSAIVALIFLLNTADEIKKSIDDREDKKEKNKITKTKTNDSNPERNIASDSTSYNPYEKAQRNSYSGVTSSDDSYREAVTVTQEPDINLTKSRSIAEAIENKKAAELEKASTQKQKESSANDKKTDSTEKKTTEKTPDVIEQTNVGNPIVNIQEDTQTKNNTESEASTPPPVITPEIVSITSASPGDGTYTTGEVFDIIVTFDEAVTTTSSSLTLSNGGTATYLSGTGTTAITYQYTAAGGEDTSDLNVSTFNVGNAVSSSSTAPSGTLTSGQNLADNQAIIIDTTAPSIVSISSPETNGRYTNTNTIDITVTFDEIINLTTSSLTLDTGETAAYTTGTGTTTLTYQYTVGAGVNSADLNVTGFNPGDAADVVSIAPNIALPASTNLANNKDLVIDNQAASIVNITGTNGTYTNTNTVDITVTFDEAVNTSTSSLSLDNGASAAYLSGDGTAAIIYRYTVGPSATEDTSDLNVTSFNIGDTTDLVGITTNTTIPAGQNLSDLHDIIIDNTAAQITIITSSKTNDTYTVGEIIDIDVTFNEVITTSALSSLTLDTTGSATYQSGSGSNTITYRYTVGAGENSADLNVTAFNVGDAVDPAGITPSATIPASDLATNKNLVIDTAQASITNIESVVPGDGTYKAGQDIDIIVTFDEAITTSNSSLTLDSGGVAVYESGSTTSSITYRYRVLATHTSSDLNVTSFNIGDAVDSVSLAPSATLPTGIAGAGNLATNNAIVIDTDAPTVAEVTSSSADITYGIGDTVAIQVIFDEIVNVTGTPQIVLNSGATVDYTSGTGTNTLLFSYDVAITEASADLDYVGTGSLSLNGGTILDTATNAADLTLANPNDPNSISDDKAIVIDGVVPTITNVTSDKANGTYGVGEIIDIQITFSENVTVSGSPTLALDSSLTAIATYQSGSGGTELTFRYTVGASETSADLEYDDTSSLALNAGTIQDAVNNNADLTLPTIGGPPNDSLSDNKAIVIDTTAATITNVTSSNADQTYGVGAVISVQVIFDEVMTVNTGGGTPTLTLETGTTDRNAVYSSGSGSNTLVFNYTVQAGDISADLAYTATTSLALNGGTIQDASTTNADLTLPSPGGANSLSDNKAIVIDTDGASVAQVYSSKGDGTYTVGEVIDIFVEFTELVDVTGTPQLTLDNGAVVNYTSGSNSNTLLFQYTVGGGQNSADLDYAATNSLALNGGTIEDAVNNAATLTLPSPNAVNSISDNQDIVIDTQGPQITDVRSTETDGTYGLTQTIDIEITFDENVTVNTGGGTPTLALNSTGSASYVSTASNVITLTYTVGAGENSTDLDYINRLTSFVLNGGTIQDALGNNANTVIPADPGVLTSISDNQDIVVDTTAPTVTQVYSDKADGTYGATEVINIYVEFSEIVNVAVATPQISLNSSATPVDYTSGSGTNTLLFTYTVGATDNSTDLDYVNTTSLDINGATIRDTGLNDAVLTLATPNASNSISDDQAIVIDTNVASITNITSTKVNGVYQSPEVIYIDVTFDELINTSTSTLTLNTGGSTATATYDSQSGTATIRYIYTVGAGEFTEDLSVTAFNVGDAADAGGNPPSTGLPAGQNLGDNKNIAIADALLTLNVYVRESTCPASPNPDLCYTSLSQALADFKNDSALNGSWNLVSKNVAVLVHIQDSWTSVDAGPVVSVSSAFTTDSTRNITIQTEGLARHSGVVTALPGHHRLSLASSGFTALNVGAEESIIDGLVIEGSNITDEAIELSGSLLLKNSIIHDLGGTGTAGISPYTNTAINITLQNIIMYNIPGGAIRLNGPAGNISGMAVRIENSIIHNVCTSSNSGVISFLGGRDYISGSGVIIKNSYIGECVAASGADRGLVLGNTANPGTFAGSDNNLHFHDTVIGSNSFSNVQITDVAPGNYDGNKYIVVDSLTPGSENFNMISNSWNLAYSGSDLTASFDPDEDIGGQAVSSANWYHIGADWTAKANTTVVNEVYITETDGTTLKPDGAYGNAATMSFVVEFSQAINVTGTPQLTHNASVSPVNCAAHTSLNNALKCDYTVGATDANLDLDFDSTAALALNSGTINDLAGNPATLTLPTPNAIYSASDNQDIIINAGALTLDIYVRPTTTGNADSCDNSPEPSLCYTGLGTAFSSIISDSSLTNKDLVNQNVKIVVHIDGDWSTAPGGVDDERADITGWTTDATRQITVQTEGVARHNGVVSCTTCYKLDPSASGGAIVIGVDDTENDSSFTIIDGLIITGTEGNYQAGVMLAATGSRVKNTIIYDLFPPVSSNTGGYGVEFKSDNAEYWLENVLMYGDVARFIMVWSTTSAPVSDTTTIHIHNSLFHATNATAGRGILLDDNANPSDVSNYVIDIRNSAFLGSYVTAIFQNLYNSGSPSFTGSANVLTSDTTAQTVFGLDDSNSAINVLLTDSALAPSSYNGNQYVIINESLSGIEDFHLADNEHNLALGSGSDLTGSIPNDFEGDAIVGARNQIGPDFGNDSSNPIVQNIYITETDGLTLKPDATYGVGETMSFIIKFSQVVNATAGIELDINANSTPLTCIKHTNVWNAIKCDYTVGSGDLSTDLDFDATTSLSLTTGSITDNYGNNAILTLPVPGAAYSASNSQAVVIDTVGPVVTNVTSAEADTTYNASEDSLEIQVIFDEPITVGGSPTLTLETGTTDRVATFDRVDSGNIAIFLYDVLPGDSSSDLDYVATTSLSLNGGTIQDALGNNADLTLATPGNTNIGSLSHDNNITIDAVAPTITNIESYTPDDGTYSSGDIDIVVTFDKAIRYGNTSTLTLDNGKTASYQAGLPGMNVTYRYTIGTGGSDDTTDLTVTAFNVGNGEDYSGNTPDTTLPATENLSDNNDIIIDTIAPTVTEVRSPTADGTYSTGQSISIEVIFSEAVNVVNTPQLALNSGATVNYSSGTGSTTLVFTYTVGGGEVSSDLDYVATNSLTLNGGTIRDNGSLDADLTLASPNAVNSISDDKAIVIASDPPEITNITSAKANGFYSSPEIIDIAVTFDNSVDTSTLV